MSKIDEIIAEDAQGSLKPNSSSAGGDPKSKVETLKSIVGAASSMTNTELTKWYTSMIDLYPGVVKAPGSADSNRATNNMKAGGTPIAPMPIVKIKEDIQDLFKDDAALLEQADTIVTLLEAAIQVRVTLAEAELTEKLEAEYATKLTEEVEAFIAETDETISTYLAAAVDKWMTDNEVAIVDTLRLENAETFMQKLQGLFTESFWDVPEERVDIVAEMSEHVEAVEAELTDALSKVAELTEQLTAKSQEAVLESALEGLTLVDSEKLKGLVESVDYVNADDYAKKIGVIKEKFFPGTPKVKNDGVETLNEQNLGVEEKSVFVDPLIEAAARIMSQR
jgi:hypothetical protein